MKPTILRFIASTPILHAHLKAALAFASTDETREHLSCIRIETTCDRVRLIATDGHTMIVTEFRALEAWSGVTHLAIADAANLLRAIDLQRAHTSCAVDRGTHEAPLEMLMLKHNPKEDPFFSALTRADRPYPPYRQVLPSAIAPDSKVEVEISPEYMARACSALSVIHSATKHEHCGKKRMPKANTGISVMPSGDENAPIVIASEDAPDTIVIVMPRRHDGKYRMYANTTLARFRAPDDVAHAAE